MNYTYKIKVAHFLCLMFFMSSIQGHAQVSDSIPYIKKPIKKSILPVAFIGTGILVNNSKPEKDLQTKLRDMVGNSFEFRIDDYLQYAPIGEMYIADMAGIKSKSHWFNQTIYLFISNILTASITQGLKYITLKTRPNGAPYSFPSGHTTFAFTNATVLYNEFHRSSMLLASSGYVFATTTGVFRMLNNKHWLSDVLTGAGIGILITNWVYYFEPLKNFNPFKISKKEITLIPLTDSYHYGLYFSYRF